VGEFVRPSVMAVVAHLKVAVGGELDAFGHSWDGGHRRHVGNRGHVGATAVVLEGLEALEAFHADVLHLLAGFVEFACDFGEDAAHDICAFCVRRVGRGGLGGDGKEFELWRLAR